MLVEETLWGSYAIKYARMYLCMRVNEGVSYMFFLRFNVFSLNKKSLWPCSRISNLQARGPRYKTALLEYACKCFVK